MKKFLFFCLLSLSMSCGQAFANSNKKVTLHKSKTSDIRIVRLWDGLALNFFKNNGKWTTNSEDLALIKKSLVQKIKEEKFERLKSNLSVNTLFKAFGSKINFYKREDSVITFFIGIAKKETDFVFGKEVNLEPREQKYKTFIEALATHIQTVNKDIGSALNHEGKSVLKGYFVICSNEYEIAFMEWDTKTKPAIFDPLKDYTKRTGPQGASLFEINLVWEDPYIEI